MRGPTGDLVLEANGTTTRYAEVAVSGNAWGLRRWERTVLWEEDVRRRDAAAR